MELYQTFHPTVFLISLLWGAFIYEIYDINRFLRYVFKSHKYVIILLDILFMVLCSVIVFIFSLAYNFGKPRIYMLVGMAISALTLRFTVGKLSIVLFIKIFSIFSVIIQKNYVFFKKVLTKLLKSFAFLVYNLGVIIKRLINRFVFLKKVVRMRKKNNISAENVVISDSENVVKEVTPVKKKEKKKYRFLLITAVVIFALYAAYMLISQFYQIEKKQSELDALNNKISVQEIKNDKLTDIYNLSDKDNEEYIEKKAKEDGYLHAGERVFVNISGD